MTLTSFIFYFLLNLVKYLMSFSWTTELARRSWYYFLSWVYMILTIFYLVSYLWSGSIDRVMWKRKGLLGFNVLSSLYSANSFVMVSCKALTFSLWLYLMKGRLAKWVNSGKFLIVCFFIVLNLLQNKNSYKVIF